MTVRFPGLRVLLVEDESAVAMLVEDMLEELGCTIAASPGDLDAALEAAATVALDLAILDVNLSGRPVFPVAAVLAARNAPFLFASGYGAAGIPAEFRDRPVVGKPFRLAELSQTISQALQGLALG